MPYKIGKRWKAQVRKEGHRREKTFNSKKEAIDWENEMLKKPVIDWYEKTDTVCLTDWAQAYLDNAKVMFTDKTYKEKKSVFKRFLSETDNTMPVNELSRKTVMDYIVKQFKQRSGYAANKDRKNLIAAWHWGVEYMEPALPRLNPCMVARMPEIRHPRYVPPEEDFWEVYEQAEGQDRVLLLAFLYLAARRGEIFSLTWSDVDFVNSRVRLKTRKRKDGTLEFDVLPMTLELRAALRWWWENRPIKDSPYVFICLDKNQKGRENYGKPYAYRHQFMRQLCKSADVKRFGFHAIRHLSATLLFNKGYAVAVIQLILRHKSASTTERYLRSLGLERAREALEDLSQQKGEVLFFPVKGKRTEPEEKEHAQIDK